VSLDGPQYLNRGRAESFGSIAADYDRYRPTYPKALIDDLVALGPRTVLDIGTGTGKAATLLAARGLDVLGVEIDARMAEVARSHGLPVEEGAFETWDDAGRTFDLITCAQAWHWVDPALGVPKLARLLNRGGSAVLFWNYEEFDEPVRSVLDTVYAEYAPELSRSVVVGGSRHDERPYIDDLQRGQRFASVESRHYRWQHTYPVDEWIGMIGTHSDHLQLGGERLAALSAAMRAALLRVGPHFTSRFGTYVIQARVAG